VAKFAMELQFTETYRRHQHDHPAIREACCLRAQFPAILRPPEQGDLFAGRIEFGAVGFSPQDGGFGYFCMLDRLDRALAGKDLDPEERAQVAEMRAFWAREASAARVRARFTPELARWLSVENWEVGPAVAYPIYRMLGGCLDFDKLVRLGLPGLREEVRRHKAVHTDGPDAQQVYTGMEMALDLVADVCCWYADQVEATAAGRTDLEMAAVLRRVAEAPPATLREAIQLSWLWALLSGHRNYGRMDVYLGDFLARDLDEGRITEAEALAMLQSLWRLIRARKLIFDGRVILGGRGRRNEVNADRFALLAMEATRTVRETEPQVTLRCYRGMNPALWEKALQVIGEGRTYPILYNDDVNVPAVARAFGVSEAEAAQYMPFSCGEYVLDHASYGSPNGVLNLLKALEAALHNGHDGITGAPIGLGTGDPAGFTRFEDLWEAYRRQVEHFVRVCAQFQVLVHEEAAKAGPFLLTALLYDDCIARGRGMFDGGVRALGGTLEVYGLVNAADSLAAIRQVVYEERRLTLPELVAALDADFAGRRPLQRHLAECPKYGNDDDVADAMLLRVYRHVCGTISAQAGRPGLDTYLPVIINNSANTVLGRRTAASADGRRAGAPMANANNPSGGSDRSGITAMLNSLVKLDPSLHAGAVQNLKLSRELFTTRLPELMALLETYFENGGTQVMITVVSRGDLEAAMREPEKYPHIFVRVGGFTARFVRLERDVQLEILSRTLY